MNVAGASMGLLANRDFAAWATVGVAATTALLVVVGGWQVRSLTKATKLQTRAQQLVNLNSYLLAGYLDRRFIPPLPTSEIRQRIFTMRDGRRLAQTLVRESLRGPIDEQKWNRFVERTLCEGQWENRFVFELSGVLDRLASLIALGAVDPTAAFALNAVSWIFDWAISLPLVDAVRKQQEQILQLTTRSGNTAAFRAGAQWLAYASAVYLWRNTTGWDPKNLHSIRVQTVDQLIRDERQTRHIYLESLGAPKGVKRFLAQTLEGGRTPKVKRLTPDRGPTAGQTTITISGKRFSSPAVVSFGTAAASDVKVLAPTEITAAAPRGSGEVQVVVTVRAGTSALTKAQADRFTYVAKPVVTGVSPSTGPEAGETNVTITGEQFVEGATVSFGRERAMDIKLVSATEITCTSPSGRRTVDVRVETVGGTSPLESAARFTYI
jgi:hypothetical protein